MRTMLVALTVLGELQGVVDVMSCHFANLLLGRYWSRDWVALELDAPLTLIVQ